MSDEGRPFEETRPVTGSDNAVLWESMRKELDRPFEEEKRRRYFIIFYMAKHKRGELHGQTTADCQGFINNKIVKQKLEEMLNVTDLVLTNIIEVSKQDLDDFLE